MKKKAILSSAALVGMLSAGGAIEQSQAADKLIHCKGISTKWVNDCGANGHECSSHASKNFDAQEWLKMTKKDCQVVQKALKNKAVKSYIERIQKGTVVATKRGKKF